MDFDLEKVTGIGEYRDVEEREDGEVRRRLYKVLLPEGEGKVFLVVNKNTLEVRCDAKLSAVLREKYESVMESRYYGRGGIEIVRSGQLSDEEMDDLVRLSYNLSQKED